MQFKQQGEHSSFWMADICITIEVINATLGIIKMKTRMLDLKPVNYVYDFQLITANGGYNLF
jgi:hypothetical protein